MPNEMGTSQMATTAQGPMGGALLAARAIHAHLDTAPVLLNTLWQWTPVGVWVAV
ncbi:MAG TPA: hypothetical protein VFE37_05875 [Chloroflexota bacterium]|nr:hypothetical protein [Chloroflexota bacterium]